MKNFLLLFFLALGLSGQAQVERGRYLIGGNVDISWRGQGTSTDFNMHLSPTIGVFVVKGFAIGGRYTFGVASSRDFNKAENEYRTVTTFTSGVGPLLKYYYGKKSLKGLISANVNYLTSVTLRPKGGGVDGTNGFSATGLLGMAYFFNPYVGLESGLYVSGTGYQGRLPVTRIGFSIGIFAFLDKKKKE